MATKRKRKSKPTSRKRAGRQSVKDRYAHAREDAQLLGLIPTSPEEALKPERVDPSVQEEQAFPALIGEAIRKGWATEDHKKPRLVDELHAIATLAEYDNPKTLQAKVQAINALLRGDQMQYERDHPEEAAKAKGGTKVAVGVKVTNETVETFDPQAEYQRMAELAMRDPVSERLAKEEEHASVNEGIE